MYRIHEFYLGICSKELRVEKKILYKERARRVLHKLIDFGNTLLNLPSNIGSADIAPKSSNDTSENGKKVDRSKEIEETEEALNELDEINKFKIPKIDEKILEEKEVDKTDKTEDDNAMTLTKEELQEMYHLGYVWLKMLTG